MITYGSYMKKDNSLEKSVRQIEIFVYRNPTFSGWPYDHPAVFVFSGGNEEALGKGPSLMFITLPKVFDNMTLGGVIGAVFFLLVLFAALTSSISLMETNVSIIRDKTGLEQKENNDHSHHICIASGCTGIPRIRTSGFHPDHRTGTSGFLRLPEQQCADADRCYPDCISIGFFNQAKGCV